MNRSAALAFVTAVGCADPVVDLSFDLPRDPMTDDTSCVTSVEVYAAGKNYPIDTNDYVGVTVQVDHPPTYNDLVTAMRGKFNVPVPPTGLASIEVYGWNGQPSWETTDPPADLVFFARTPYDGGDVTIPLVPNVSCKHKPTTVRPLDLVGFIAGNYACAAAAIPDGDPAAPGYVDFGTLSPVLYQNNRLRYFGGIAFGNMLGGVAIVDGLTATGPQSCLAIGSFSDGHDAISCAVGAGICGHPGELEVSVLPNDFTTPQDPDAKFTHAVIGAVFSTARRPVTGAVITVDPRIGSVAYLDLDVATKRFTLAEGAATTASGLFIVYTDSLAEVTVASGGNTAKVHVGSLGDDLTTEYLSTTVVVMP